MLGIKRKYSDPVGLGLNFSLDIVLFFQGVFLCPCRSIFLQLFSSRPVSALAAGFIVLCVVISRLSSAVRRQR